MRRFVKSVAEDSSLTRSYVVLILTADALNNYRWDDEDDEKWTSFRNFLKAAAITAGTPGFLIEIVEGSDVGLSWNDAIKNRAMDKNEQWKFGANDLKYRWTTFTMTGIFVILYKIKNKILTVIYYQYSNR